MADAQVTEARRLLDEAWATAVASPGQVPEAQWHDLIGPREKDHPADVIRPFQDLIELGLERTGDKYRYPKAIKALKRLREDYARAGDESGPGCRELRAKVEQDHWPPYLSVSSASRAASMSALVAMTVGAASRASRGSVISEGLVLERSRSRRSSWISCSS